MRRAPMEKPTRRTGRPPWAPLISTCASSSPARAALQACAAPQLQGMCVTGSAEAWYRVCIPPTSACSTQH